MNPTDEQIREVLTDLNVDRDGVGWAGLGRSDTIFFQVKGDKYFKFVMEYQDGDGKQHYRSAREDFELETAVQAFADYRDGTIDWSDYGEWNRMTQ